MRKMISIRLIIIHYSVLLVYRFKALFLIIIYEIYFIFTVSPHALYQVQHHICHFLDVVFIENTSVIKRKIAKLVRYIFNGLQMLFF